MLEQLPLVLALNRSYEPLDWIDYEEYAIKYAKGDILASLGQHETTLHGGTNARTGLQTTLIMDSIVVVDSTISPYAYTKATPALTNDALFLRDLFTCGYCGQKLNRHKLTRDHIIPVSKNGPDTWMNTMTACRGCNGAKDNLSLEQSGMQLLWAPYTPSRLEYFLLKGRNVLADQAQFILNLLPKESRLHTVYN